MVIFGLFNGVIWCFFGYSSMFGWCISITASIEPTRGMNRTGFPGDCFS